MPQSRPKVCVACSRRATRLRPAGWTCQPCWRASVGCAPYANVPVPAPNPSEPPPPYRHIPPPHNLNAVIVNACRALILRRCAEEPRSTTYLAEVTLCVTLNAVHKMTRKMVRRGLLRKHGRHRCFLEATKFGLEHLAAFDAKSTHNTKESNT